MAHILVQPKRKSYWWLWLLLALIAIAAIFYFSKNNMLKGGKATTGIPTTRDSSAVIDTATNTPASDSALHSPNGITSQ